MRAEFNRYESTRLTIPSNSRKVGTEYSRWLSICEGCYRVNLSETKAVIVGNTNNALFGEVTLYILV
jgi:hypothetical protein